MTVEVSKLFAAAVVGGSSGVTVSKVVAFVILAPGSESGGSSTHRSYTYAQRFTQESA